MATEIVLSGNTASGLLKPAGGFPNRAYVTFLAGNGVYVKGVVGLAKGLRKVKTAYPLVVAVLPDVQEEHRQILESQGCIVKEIEPVYPPAKQTQFAMAYNVINYSKLYYSKLRIWKFDEYSKMIYLDADIQVYGNIDHLFDYPDGALYVASDCFCKDNKMINPGRYYQEELYFNDGMFIFQPNKKTCKELLHTLKLMTSPTPLAVQDCLKKFFKDDYKRLSPINYLNVAMLWRHPEKAVDIDTVKVVHYGAAVSKPWMYTAKEENMQREDIKMLVKKWWDVYNDESLDYKPPEPVSLQPLIRALSEGGTVHYITAPSAA